MVLLSHEMALAGLLAIIFYWDSGAARVMEGSKVRQYLLKRRHGAGIMTWIDAGSAASGWVLRPGEVNPSPHPLLTCQG